MGILFLDFFILISSFFGMVLSINNFSNRINQYFFELSRIFWNISASIDQMFFDLIFYFYDDVYA